MFRKSGQAPLTAPEHVVVQSPPVLQALKTSWPNPVERFKTVGKKSRISRRSFAARLITRLKFVCTPLAPVEKITETVTGSELRFDMKTSDMNVPPPPATSPAMGT